MSREGGSSTDMGARTIRAYMYTTRTSTCIKEIALIQHTHGTVSREGGSSTDRGVRKIRAYICTYSTTRTCIREIALIQHTHGTVSREGAQVLTGELGQ